MEVKTTKLEEIKILSKEIARHIHDYPRRESIVFIFLDGDTALTQSALVPAGHIYAIKIRAHAVETNFEDVVWQCKVDDTIICPTKWGNNARPWITTPGTVFEHFRIQYPVYEEAKISITINAAPTSGVQFVILFEPFPTPRTGQKSFMGLKRAESKTITEIST